MEQFFAVSFVFSLIIMFSSITTAWIMYLRFKRLWMKQYVLYALVWAFGLVQTGLLLLGGAYAAPENQSTVFLVFLMAVWAVLFVVECIAPPFLLFSFAGINMAKKLKAAIIINPFLVPLALILVFPLSIAAGYEGTPETLLRISLSIAVSFSALLSLAFQFAAISKILKARRRESGFVIFIILTFVYQIITLVFSATPVPGRISIGIYGYHIAAVIFTIIAYLEILTFNLIKLSREFSGKEREISETAVGEYNLTARETDIANLLLTGLNSREIGEKLFITKKTVDTHIYNIYKKCGVKNKLEFFNLLG
ncbi:MAG: helix-turn-helix transcriptional regulator [Spirochaetales bacterium]|nr:helix-turn-helix transcriptional regulator [Spirochaetales bacterium]